MVFGNLELSSDNKNTMTQCIICNRQKKLKRGGEET